MLENSSDCKPQDDIHGAEITTNCRFKKTYTHFGTKLMSKKLFTNAGLSLKEDDGATSSDGESIHHVLELSHARLSEEDLSALSDVYIGACGEICTHGPLH